MKYIVGYMYQMGILTEHSTIKENVENLTMADYPLLSPVKRFYAPMTNLITETRPVSLKLDFDSSFGKSKKVTVVTFQVESN